MCSSSVAKARAFKSFQLPLLHLFAFIFFFFFLFLFLYPQQQQQQVFDLKKEEEKKMSSKMVDATISNFDQVFDKFKSEAHKNQFNLILFLADKDPKTSLSWCPDCVKAEPIIYKRLEASPGDVALLRAFVGDRPTWRNPHHPWRVDSTFKLKGVPTLVRWENDTITGRLEDYEAHLEHKIDALIASK